MRFSLVDRITDLEVEKSISAVKNLSMAEEYLADHFPGFPVMPGVLMLESLVQSSAWLIRATEDFAHSTILLKQARALKFNSFVTPGKTLCVTATIQKWNDDECVLKATSTVDGESAVSARITLGKHNLADHNSSLADVDRDLIETLRSQFKQIWQPAEVEADSK
jgi:3-hydroxyacyl-[acyl-carrier-protein] dehydratase